uniref:SWIM-type zinc finger 7 associated protein 1 n=1 Tax=Gouania willdenowi TaxID=441366 RepID=A0A8C5G209_GOUWI
MIKPHFLNDFKIQFSYPRTVEELLQQVASLHESTNTSPAPPSLIIVDRLECFLRSHSRFPQGEQSCAAHVCALLCDAAAFFSQKLESQGSSSGPCRLITSFLPEAHAEKAEGGPSATDPVLDVLDRYFEVRCTLDPDRGYGATAAGAAELFFLKSFLVRIKVIHKAS